jgi:hypothetical protein
MRLNAIRSRTTFGIRLLSFCAFGSSFLVAFLGAVLSGSAIQTFLHRSHRIQDRPNPCAYVVIPLRWYRFFSCGYRI